MYWCYNVCIYCEHMLYMNLCTCIFINVELSVPQELEDINTMWKLRSIIVLSFVDCSYFSFTTCISAFFWIILQTNKCLILLTRDNNNMLSTPLVCLWSLVLGIGLKNQNRLIGNS